MLVVKVINRFSEGESVRMKILANLISFAALNFFHKIGYKTLFEKFKLK